MKTADMLDDSFPHGTVEGHRLGCKSSHCPGEMPCRDVAMRYRSDWGFKTALDAGHTIDEILAEEAHRAVEQAAADKRARRAQAEAAKARHVLSRPKKPKPERTVSTWRADIEARRDQVRALYEDGLLDREIAARLDMPKRTVLNDRHALGLAGRTEAFNAAMGARNREKVAVLLPEGLTDAQIAERIGLSVPSVSQHRRALGIDPHKAPHPRKGARLSDLWRQVEQLYKEGLTDAEICARLGKSRSRVATIRGKLGLPAQNRVKARA